MEDWDLRAFIFSQDDLDKDEKELCFKLLDGQGSAKKRRAFLALNDADLQNVGIGQISTRKVLLLAIAGAAQGPSSANTAAVGAVAGLGPQGAAAAGAAAGLGTKSAAGDGTGLLDIMAPRLVVKPKKGSVGTVWEVNYPDGKRCRRLYLDAPGDAVKLTQSWAEIRCEFAHDLNWSSAHPALWVSGLIKTGKTYTLLEVVPAVLAEALSKQPPGHPLKGMFMLQLNGLSLQRKDGGAALLYDLLQKVVKWAARTNMPVERAAWQEAQRVLAAGPNAPGMLTCAGTAVVQLFAGFQAPVLVLLDELQALLHPTDTRGELDRRGADYIRDNVLREILVGSPPTVLWAFTGSSMAMAWIALAAMPVNGVVPLFQITPVHLPSALPPALMQELVQDTLRRSANLQEEDVQQLLEPSGPSPALFATMVEAWIRTPPHLRTDIKAFTASFHRAKLQVEVQKEWTLSLAYLTDEQRSSVLDLASVATGAQLDYMDAGLKDFLLPHLQRNEKGRYYLKDANQRQLLRVVIGRGGKLRTDWTGLESGLTLVQLDWGWQLMQLGDVADYLLGLLTRDQAIPEQVDGADRLKAMLQDLADKADAQLPAGDSVAGRWEALGSFTQVLRSRYNTGSRSWYERHGTKRLNSHLDLLVFFLRLSRNALAHQKPWGGPDTVDAEVVLALPRLVKMPITELSEVARVGVSALAPATVLAATDAAAAEESDGDGGQGDSGRSGDENSGRSGAVCARAVRSTGGGLEGCASMSCATALSSGAGAAPSKAGRAPLGWPGPGRVDGAVASGRICAAWRGSWSPGTAAYMGPLCLGPVAWAGRWPRLHGRWAPAASGLCCLATQLGARCGGAAAAIGVAVSAGVAIWVGITAGGDRHAGAGRHASGRRRR